MLRRDTTRRQPCGKYTTEYRTWGSMRYRCLNKQSAAYARYGGRGITICGKWDSFDVFLADMGPKPTPRHSLDRIDNNGNYCPENCRWATVEMQTRNQSNTKLDAEKVNEIRGRWEHGEPQQSIAARFGLAPSMVSRIVRRERWQDVP